MRTSTIMLRWLSAGICALIILLAISVTPVLAGDTGTYQILNYVTTLEPENNGDVKITYEQDWKVLSGNIPWITVGLSNNKYSIQSYSGAATKVSPVNSGGFTGVRVDLDKSYVSGQTFSIKLVILQSNILERLTNEKVWRINYTPGWYDRAVTNHLQITLISPVDYQTYSSVSPMPASVNNNVITWERNNLAPGERSNIVVESTDGSFLTEAPSNQSQGGGFPIVTVAIIIGIIIAIGLLISWGIRKNQQARDAELKARIADYEKQMAEDKQKKAEIEEGFAEYVEKKKIQPDEQGRYYDNSYGGYITPAIWAAIILTQQMHNNSGYSGGSTPRSSCACACVSCACACACACAGGGAAGCARKTIHECDKDLSNSDFNKKSR